MPGILQNIDHAHVHVTDLQAAEGWYERALGLRRVAALESWATSGGPLMMGNAEGTIKLALFERPVEKGGSTIALGTSGEEFMGWLAHLTKVLGQPLVAVDHQIAWSMYFCDPDGNLYEITSYDYVKIAAALREQRGVAGDEGGPGAGAAS